MPSLRDIQRRIRSVEKTQQITSAMRMVAAAKLRRAQNAIIAARPYSDRIYATMQEIGRREPPDEHPLLVRRDVQTLEVVVVTSDRGLCGAFNSNAIKHAEATIRARGGSYENLVVTPIGRKAAEYFRKHRPSSVGRAWTDIGNVDVKLAIKISDHLQQRFIEGECDEVVFVANRFVSALVQDPVDRQLLPLAPTEGAGEAENGDAMPYKVEPDTAKVLAALLPRAIEFSVYRVLLENQAGEHAARMTSMESATRNTEELISSLTLQFNRARQAAITKELVEIVTGAQALEG